MQKNDEFEIKITDMTDEGLGIGKHEGFTWFIKDSIVGDTVLCGVTKIKKTYGFARVIRIIEPSADRTEAPCPIARACGGCQIQQMSYDAQLRLKSGKVRNVLTRLGGFSEEEVDRIMEPIVPSDDIFRYRNKAQFPIGRDREGHIVAGFYAGRTHSIIPASDCLLGAEENKIILDSVIGWMKSFGVEPYDEKSLKGTVRHVLIRKSRASGDMMVCLVINSKKLPREKELVEALAECCEGAGIRLMSLSYSPNLRDTNVIMGDEYITIYGDPYLEDSIRLPDGEKIGFRLSPLSFYQVNPGQMEKLYAGALEFAELSGNETVWDLYCGIGTISLFLAKKAGYVYGVEIVPQAIEDARENALRNGIANAEFFTGKAEEVLPHWYEVHAADKDRGARPDVMVVDPPRKGCDEACLETMVKMQPRCIVYVSCNPATLARDLRYLCSQGYRLTRVRPYDLFPQSVHVEVVIQMTYCGDRAKNKG